MADPLRSIKSLNYLDKLMAQRAAAQAGAEEAIIVDPDGFVVEGAMRNVFAVLRDAVVTPPLSRGLLPGITREAVLEVMGERPEVQCSARDISLAELHGADECFLTSSLAEILPVASVDGHLTAAAPGPITKMAVQGYRRLVAAELDLGGELKRPG
jgi:branched-subunit amino acid aminotransferase/4-amino-4-deoxychorismate lyase